MPIFKRVRVYSVVFFFFLLDGRSDGFIFYSSTNWLSILITHKNGPIIALR